MEHDFKAFPELTDAQMTEFYFQSPHKQIVEDFRATVIKVHDGDTCTVRTDFRDFDFPIRFARIDTKELNAGGHDARDWAKSRLEGKNITVGIDKKNRVGRYGRLIGEIILDGMNINDEEMRMGIATPFAQKNEGKITDINATLDMKQWF